MEQVFELFLSEIQGSSGRDLIIRICDECRARNGYWNMIRGTIEICLFDIIATGGTPIEACENWRNQAAERRTWPSRCPPELFSDLQSLASWRSRPGPQDMWTAFATVMREKNVPAPHFEAWPEERGDRDQ
ncbi:MAG: hypothetical protein AAFX07_00725 [Pseudomonadota bacterium]